MVPISQDQSMGRARGRAPALRYAVRCGRVAHVGTPPGIYIE